MKIDHLSLVIKIIAGHNTLGYHILKIASSSDDICIWCWEAELSEVSYHFLCQSPSLFHRSKKLLGSFFFQNLAELNGCDPSKLLALIKLKKS